MSLESLAQCHAAHTVCVARGTSDGAATVRARSRSTMHAAALLQGRGGARTCAAEGVASQIEGRDGGAEQAEGEEYQHPVLDHARDVHGQRAGLPDQQEHRLRSATWCT